MTEMNADTLKRALPLRIIIPLGIAGVIILSMLITMFAVTSGKEIRNGVAITGIDVSKLDKAHAIEKVNKEVEGFLHDNIISVEYEGKKNDVPFNEFLSGYKVDEAVEEAYNLGRNKNIFSNAFVSLSLQFNHKNIKLEPILDESFITQFMDTYALKLDTPLEENTYKLDGNRLKLRNGEKGFAIDKTKAINDIKNVLMSGINGNVLIVKIEREPVPFDVDKIYDEICKPPVDAKYETKNGKGYLVKAENGYSFNKSELASLIEENKNNTKSFYLNLNIIEPSVKSVDTNGLFGEVLGEFTSKITDKNANRLTNVSIATERINGVILNPDEVFYYLRHVEPITVAGGYKIANVYNNGKIEQDIGGGVCQVSSALYSAVLYSNLEVVKRYNHSLTVGYVPYGQDATVSSGEVDFRFKNSTNAPIKIMASTDKSGVYIKILGEKLEKDLTVKIENVTIQTNPPKTVINDDPSLPAGKIVTDTNGKTGYVVDTYKNYYRNGTFVERVFVSKSVYKTLDTVQRRGTGAAEMQAEPFEPTKPVEPTAATTPVVEATPAAPPTIKPTATAIAPTPKPLPSVTPAASAITEADEDA